MRYQIKNDKIKLEVMSRGAQMCSIQDAAGTEYLWQGDEVIWDDQAPTLFPYVGRLYNQKYQYKEQEYSMTIHGFAMQYDFVCRNIREDYLVCTLEDTDETRKTYPFSFCFEVHYEVIENTIRVSYIVKNKDDKTMYFGIGGHPGFNVPLRGGEKFEDYYLQFPQDAKPQKVMMTDTGYVLGGTEDFLLKEGDLLPLQHQLFDHDAIVLENMGQEIQLCGPRGPIIRVRYPQMPYLGLWHRPKTDAQYVCIEPWSSLPARHEVVEKLEEKQDLIQLAVGDKYCNIWEITVCQTSYVK